MLSLSLKYPEANDEELEILQSYAEIKNANKVVKHLGIPKRMVFETLERFEKSKRGRTPTRLNRIQDLNQVNVQKYNNAFRLMTSKKIANQKAS